MCLENEPFSAKLNHTAEKTTDERFPKVVGVWHRPTVALYIQNWRDEMPQLTSICPVCLNRSTLQVEFTNAHRASKIRLHLFKEGGG